MQNISDSLGGDYLKELDKSLRQEFGEKIAIEESSYSDNTRTPYATTKESLPIGSLVSLEG